jgi:hypothetical protein
MCWDMLYGTFIRTTDPDTDFAQLIAPDVFFSLFLHTLVYFAAYLALVKLFRLPYYPIAFLAGIIVLMCLGFAGRLARVKGIRAYNEKHAKTKEDKKDAAKVIRRGYFTWMFFS